MALDWAWALGFCDDLMLLAPTRDAVQIMLDICQRFLVKFNLQLSTGPNPEKEQDHASLSVAVPKLRRSQET